MFILKFGHIPGLSFTIAGLAFARDGLTGLLRVQLRAVHTISQYIACVRLKLCFIPGPVKF
ncbi:hypothetical protein D770_10660 [Flammeovirgaceae bacterium 311]|nr:hypothetical protein D770_10660 [Flammeovirgaceae bacterium 311]